MLVTQSGKTQPTSARFWAKMALWGVMGGGLHSIKRRTFFRHLELLKKVNIAFKQISVLKLNTYSSMQARLSTNSASVTRSKIVKVGDLFCHEALFVLSGSVAGVEKFVGNLHLVDSKRN